VFQSFPGAEEDGTSTPRVILDTQIAQRQHNAWDSAVVPAQRAMLQNALEALQSQAPTHSSTQVPSSTCFNKSSKDSTYPDIALT
jgi:hypothetical protein